MSHSSSSYASRQRSPRKHLTGIGLVILLHALLLWAIASGLARKVVRMTENTVEAVLMTEAPPPAPTPPPKAPPPPKTPAPPPPAPTSTAPAITQAPAPPAPTPAPAAPAIRTGAVIQAGAHCAKPDYPSASRRMEEEGTVTLKFLIGVDGKVIQADIEKSSGFTRLDEAARNALSKCQFRPGTVDGKPEQSWASIKYTWRLE
ncbi:MAG: energy transducer TonB [Burkholderiales bacterium 35-55-47]|uniref:energy transducer TonB n=1 Tax=Limnohabitans sp. TaxID=1907725 RepID=UPI000BCBE5BD|nr:energy transducer TonB [Limnohabitans sp.]OYY20111.1 MAG: energy transducer TonB [Burkholderiales bacterium 35-55-47]OYZ74279.1 MAG: energy transducer TonB [Burkholderiales bacterium 24-55-52]OZB01830.1 MAG: energy transducer TonB [Burkholderiales bacterium 39-55-53]HQS25736.1 energy transducer TonB [Limnohabitans sp.]